MENLLPFLFQTDILVHLVPNFSVWGVTLDKEGFVYAVDCGDNFVYKH